MDEGPGDRPGPGSHPVGPHVTGHFSFLPIYPFDTRVILRVPSRRPVKNPPPYGETPHALRDALNRAALNIDPDPVVFRTPPPCVRDRAARRHLRRLTQRHVVHPPSRPADRVVRAALRRWQP